MLNCIPVGFRNVAEIGHAGEMIGEYLARAGVNVGHPCKVPAEHFLYGQVQAAVAGAQ